MVLTLQVTKAPNYRTFELLTLYIFSDVHLSISVIKDQIEVESLTQEKRGLSWDGKSNKKII